MYNGSAAAVGLHGAAVLTRSTRAGREGKRIGEGEGSSRDSRSVGAIKVSFTKRGLNERKEGSSGGWRQPPSIARGRQLALVSRQNFWSVGSSCFAIAFFPLSPAFPLIA